MELLNPNNIRVSQEAGVTPCLVGARCGECGVVVFPALPVCPKCKRREGMSEVEIGRKAKLYSHTIARFAPQGFKAPFFQVFVDLPEGPRIFSLVGDQCPVGPGVLEDGMDMRLIVEPLADTEELADIHTYKYVPDPCVDGRTGVAADA
jgi:hypothetical protein